MSTFQNSVLSKASAFGDAVALLDRATGREVRYSGLASFLSSILKEWRFRKDRPVATWAAADFTHASLLLALLAEDCLIAPLSPRLPESEAIHRAESIGAGVFWKPEGLRRLASAQPPPTLASGGTVLFTSGSSGLPRAVWHDFQSHIANASGAAGRIPLGPGCAWLLTLPINHVSGFSILIRCLLAGAAVVFPDRNLPFKTQVADPVATHLSVVGVQLRRLLAEGASLARLKAVLAGGGPIDVRLVSDAINAGVPLHLTYGMTEAASQIATSVRLQTAPSVIHAGKPLPDREVRISPDGEIQLRGEVLPRAILASGGARSALDADGWFSTGDCGSFDAEGNLVVSGRRNRMFISGGENICPEMIEALLVSCPDVRRAVVVGVPHEEFGVRPVAFVAGDVTGDRLTDFIKSRLEGFYVPDAFLPWPDEVSEEDPKVDFQFFTRLAQSRRLW